MKRYQRGAFQLTGAGKALLILVGLAVLGYAAWTYRDRLPGHLFQSTVRTADSSSTTGPAPAAAAATGSGASAGAVLARVRESGVLRVGMEPDAPPLHFINDRKQEDGFDFRLAGLLAEKLGARRVQIVEGDYEDLPAKLGTGEIDILMAGYVPDSSVEGVEWSIGYLDFGLCMIVNERDAATLKSPSDLAGKRIAIYDDPAAERWVREHVPNARIQKFSGANGWFEALEGGQVDALIYDYPFAAEEIKAHPRTLIARFNLNQSKYAVGVARNDYDLLNAINGALDTFRSSEQYGNLMREYLATASSVFMRPVAGRKTYTVVAGDTLSRIAAAQLGSADGWKQIWELNRDRVANENLIYPKLVLLMP